MPHFKNIILTNFYCNSCGVSNNSVQGSNSIEEYGKKYELLVETKQDLNRLIVKSEFANIKLPDLEIEIDGGQNGKTMMTTVEGLLEHIINDLSTSQELKKSDNQEDTSMKIQKVIDRLHDFSVLKTSFSLILDDITGNSHIEKR